jgi:hypothetical protein
VDGGNQKRGIPAFNQYKKKEEAQSVAEKKKK